MSQMRMSAMPDSGSISFCKCWGLSVITSSHVGRTVARNRCPPWALPSARPTTKRAPALFELDLGFFSAGRQRVLSRRPSHHSQRLSWCSSFFSRPFECHVSRNDRHSLFLLSRRVPRSWQRSLIRALRSACLASRGYPCGRSCRETSKPVAAGPGCRQGVRRIEGRLPVPMPIILP